MLEGGGGVALLADDGLLIVKAFLEVIDLVVIYYNID